MMGQPMMAQQYATDVWTAAGKCTAGTVPGVYRKHCSGDYGPENIDLIKDVPLEVTVELGKNYKIYS